MGGGGIFFFQEIESIYLKGTDFSSTMMHSKMLSKTVLWIYNAE
jgi:hypothetical protein